MAMISVENVAPNGVSKFIPEHFKQQRYVKLTAGQKKHIVYLARNVYPAKGPDYEPLKSKIDGHIIMKKIIYVGFDDDTYTTVKYDVPVAQMESIVGNNDESDEEWDLVELNLDVKVRTITYQARLGKRDYDAIAFEEA